MTAILNRGKLLFGQIWIECEYLLWCDVVLFVNNIYSLKFIVIIITKAVEFALSSLYWQVLSSSWNGQPFGHNRHGPNIGAGLCPFWEGGAGCPCNTMWPGWGLPSYQLASWSIRPFGYNRHGPKFGGGAGLCPFGEEELGPHLT